MNLGNPADPNLALWGWEKKKLGCRIRPETGNPAVDEIRDRLSRMTGVDVPELESVAGGRTSGRPQTGNLGKTLRTGTVRSFETSRSNTSAFGDTAGSTLLLPCTSTQSLMAFQQTTLDSQHVSKTRANIYKKFFQVPRSPPTKITFDLQRDRLRMPPSAAQLAQLRSAELLELQQTGCADEGATVQTVTKMKKSSSQSVTAKRRKMTSEQRAQSEQRKLQEAVQRRTAAQAQAQAKLVRPGSAAGSAGKEEASEPAASKAATAFKPYHGDLFCTRGVYMGGIIYQSRLGESKASRSGLRQAFNGDPLNHAQQQVKAAADGAPGITTSSEKKQQQQPAVETAGKTVESDKSSEPPVPNASQICETAQSQQADQKSLLEGEAATVQSCDDSKQTANSRADDDDEESSVAEVPAGSSVAAPQQAQQSRRRSSRTGNRADTSQQHDDATGASREAHAAKLHCANSIAAWSQHSENAVRLALEGAVSAALVLSKEESLDVRRACAVAFKNMSRHPVLCEHLVKHAAVPEVAELGVSSKYHPRCARLSRDCALCLVNLTIVDVLGIEARLVEDGVVIALMSLMNQNEELAEMCAIGLFNLTCVDKPYMYIERLVKAFVSLASSTVARVKHLCAAGLCNLSDIKAVRSRIVEEGVVQVLGSLARGAEARTRRVCAMVLHSLASAKGCRCEMVSKGAVQVLYSLSSDVDTVTLHYIASAAHRLASEEANLPRLVHEGGVTALCNICLRCPKDAMTTELCAQALKLLSQHKAGRSAIVNEGCVQALVKLLRDARDAPTLRHGLAALTNLLVEIEHHDAVLAQGGVASVIALCAHPDGEIREAVALALFNLSRGENARQRGSSSTTTTTTTKKQQHTAMLIVASSSESLMEQQTSSKSGLSQRGDSVRDTNAAAMIPAVIALSRLPEARTRTRCAATLCKLASVERNVATMVKEGCVQAFVEMLRARRDDASIVKHCCAALCRLAHEQDSAIAIANGAVKHVIQVVCKDQEEDGGEDSSVVPFEVADAETRRACCAVLSAVSAHEPCRRTLVSLGALRALTQLARDRDADDSTRLRTAVALANLSAEPVVQGEMVSAGVVPVVAELSNSYCERNQLFCAYALCNLGCHSGSELSIVEQGGVSALMMICMVRAVDTVTKQVCAKALLNLLSSADVRRAWLPRLAKEGLVQCCSTLSRLDDEETMRVCSSIFLVLSAEGHEARALLVERRATLRDAFALSRSRDRTTQVVCGKTACNLLREPDSQPHAVAAGAVRVLAQLCALGDPEAEVAAATAYWLIADKPECRREMIEQGSQHKTILPVLITNVRSPNAPTREACLKALARLAWFAEVRRPLLGAKAVPAIVAFVVTSAEELRDNVALRALRVLAFLSFTPRKAADEDWDELRREMVQDDVLPAIVSLYEPIAARHHTALISSSSSSSSSPDESGGDAPPPLEASPLLPRLSRRAQRARALGVAALRSLCECQEALERLVADGACRVLCEAVAACSFEDESHCLENAATALYLVAKERQFATELLEQGVLQALVTLGARRECYSRVAAVVHLLSLESASTRDQVCADAAVRALLVRLAEEEVVVVGQPSQELFKGDASTAASCAQSFFWFSKCSGQRKQELIADGLIPLLIRLSKHRDDKVASACSEALKNLSSGGQGGIDEGTVSTLIAMTLSTSAISNRNNSQLESDNLAELDLEPLDPDLYAPNDGEEEEDDDEQDATNRADAEPHSVSVMKMVGGVAGAGPPPPEPPEMALQDTRGLKCLDQSDGQDEDEHVGASMMFAKISAEAPTS